MALSIINMCIITALKIKDCWSICTYLLCVLNFLALHCNMLQHSAIYCISDITDIWKVCNINYYISQYCVIGNIAQPYYWVSYEHVLTLQYTLNNHMHLTTWLFSMAIAFIRHNSSTYHIINKTKTFSMKWLSVLFYAFIEQLKYVKTSLNCF